MGRLSSGKIAKIVIYDKARVNGGDNFDYSVKAAGFQANIYLDEMC